MRANQSISPGAIFTILAFAALAPGHHRVPGRTTRVGIPSPDQIGHRKSSDAREPGQITGTVLGLDGRPIAGATLVLSRAGAALATMEPEATTDDHGRFAFEGLAPGAYFFLYPPDVDDYSEPRLHRPGDDVTLRDLWDRKGGVITGMVTNASGEPVIEATVRAIRVRTAEGTVVRPSFNQLGSDAAATDDRGIYRIWGMLPGSYLVAAGGKALQNWGPPGAYDDDVPTYYPSASLADATAVQVATSQEVTGIDIRYLGTTGHKISGNITGVNRDMGQDAGVVISLADGSSGAIQSLVSVHRTGEQLQYTITSVADGQYCLIGALVLNNDFEGSSACRAVTVKGADVTGADIAISPLSTISGRVRVEPPGATGSTPDCASARPGPGSAVTAGAEPSLRAAASSPQISQTVITVRPEQRMGAVEPSPLLRVFTPAAMPDSKGDFAISKLGAGRYHLAINMPGKDWYLAGLSLPDPGGKPRPIDDEISLKPGEQLAGLAIAIRAGAAGLSGRIVPGSAGSRPAAMRVYLIPIDQPANSQAAPADHAGQASSLQHSKSAATQVAAESPHPRSSQSPEAADVPKVLKYREAEIVSDGAFALNNLAPGKYKVLALPMGAAALADSYHPLTRSAEGRARLLLESRDHGIEIDLKPCGRVADFLLKF